MSYIYTVCMRILRTFVCVYSCMHDKFSSYTTRSFLSFFGHITWSCFSSLHTSMRVNIFHILYCIKGVQSMGGSGRRLNTCGSGDDKVVRVFGVYEFVIIYMPEFYSDDGVVYTL